MGTESHPVPIRDYCIPADCRCGGAIGVWKWDAALRVPHAGVVHLGRSGWCGLLCVSGWNGCCVSPGERPVPVPAGLLPSPNPPCERGGKSTWLAALGIVSRPAAAISPGGRFFFQRHLSFIK